MVRLWTAIKPVDSPTEIVINIKDFNYVFLIIRENPKEIKKAGHRIQFIVSFNTKCF